MAFGILSGKFLTGKHPNARLTYFLNLQDTIAPSAPKHKVISGNCVKNGLTLTELSLAFIEQQSFVTSTIIGATTMEQLKENIDSIKVSLSDEILKAIDEVQAIIPDPAP
jgi:aryl-alcohol dehydrogenase-like predicted oxidoreductase